MRWLGDRVEHQVGKESGPLKIIVDALARSGRLEQARLAFEKMLTYANHVGLFGEEIGQTGEQLGNFPQAFTHLSLINAAINLDRRLDEAPGAPLRVPSRA